MSGLGLLVTASERAGSSTMDNDSGGESPRGSKRPLAEDEPPPAQGLVLDDEPAAGGGKGSAAAEKDKEKEQERGVVEEEGGEKQGKKGGEEDAGNGKAGDEQPPQQQHAAGTEEEGDLAARRGDVEFCKQNEEGLKFTTRAMDGAAAAGHLPMVSWLHEKGYGCTAAAMDLAAQGGHLEIVQWLHANRSEGCSPAALAMAAGRGHLSTVEWFHGNGMPADISKAIDEAEAGGHAKVVDWLKSHSSSNKKPRVETRPAGASTAAASSPPTFPRQPQGQQPPGQSASRAKACPPMGMFGSPFGNFSPVNGIVLPGTTVQEIVPKQAAAGMMPVSSAAPSSSSTNQKASPKPAAAGGPGGHQHHHGGSLPRLRSKMLRSPELTLASGGLSTTDERQLKAVMEFRKAYSAQALEGSNIPKDPFTLFAVWFEEARIARASEPGAMCLSTVGPTGRPSARYVMLQGFDKRGFVWYTNFESRKSQEMSHNPYGALSFWWSEVQRAVRIEGVVCKVTEKESTEYFQSRPRGSQVGAWALHQSRPVESRGSLEANVKDVQNKFSSIREVPRPPHFGGFRLRPDRIEFWKGRQTRIHDRIVYVIIDDKWTMQRLQP